MVFGSLFLEKKKTFFLTYKSFLKFIVLCSFYKSFALWSSLPSFHFFVLSICFLSLFFCLWLSVSDQKALFLTCKSFFKFVFSVFLSKFQTLIFPTILSCFFSILFVFGSLFLIKGNFFLNLNCPLLLFLTFIRLYCVGCIWRTRCCLMFSMHLKINV